MSFGVPPEGERIHKIIAERLDEAVAADSGKVTVDWRGEQRHLHVIPMPVELLYYNPDTHRIRAQRTLDPVRDRALNEDPWGAIAQDYVEFLLKRLPSDPDRLDPEFEALREDLKNFGQTEPGIITAQGILVNGNTRRAALRELGEKYIRVGVLPESATRDDINTIELSLQLRTEYKREYSYINRLLAIEEQFRSGRLIDDIVREFHTKTPTLEQDRWVFMVIEDAIKRSRTGQTAQLRYIDFEDNKEKLRELCRAYHLTAKTDPDAAETLKESRLAMMVLGYAKTDLRLAQPDFHSKYLATKLPPPLRPAVQRSARVKIPGTNISVPDAAPEVKTTRALTDTLLKAKALAQAGGKAPPGKVAAAAEIINSAKQSFERALDPAGKDARLRQRRVAAPERLSDAADLIELCIGDLAEALAVQELDSSAFDDAALLLRGSLKKLAKQAAKTFPEHGEGVMWLLKAADMDVP